jgi:hypothetical protein
MGAACGRHGAEKKETHTVFGLENLNKEHLEDLRIQ